MPAPRKRDVVALLAVGEVVAVAAEQHIDPVAADDVVVAGTGVDRDRDEGSEVPGGGEAVVAAVGIENQLFGGADVDGERRRIEAVEPDARAVGRGGELLGASTSVDLHGVSAGPTFVEVGVVARVPDHPVVAALTEDLVIGIAAGKGVVPAAADKDVEAATAEESVGPSLPEELVAP